jgi:hypothetical protein
MGPCFCRDAGWAKRSVPTIHHDNAERWWARRKRAFAHPTNFLASLVGKVATAPSASSLCRAQGVCTHYIRNVRSASNNGAAADVA